MDESVPIIFRQDIITFFSPLPRVLVVMDYRRFLLISLLILPPFPLSFIISVGERGDPDRKGGKPLDA